MTQQTNIPAVERILVVHAHPDDESISTGGTLATLVDAGARVTVLTCTRGERGEVIPDDLAHLRHDPIGLADHREGELRAAFAALGVTDHRFLGSTEARWPGREPRRYTDSGMSWGPAGAMPALESAADSLAAAEFGEIAADIAAVVDRVRPDAIVSYNEAGGYGHPDHIRASLAARRAAEVYHVPFYAIEPQDSAAAVDVVVDVAPVVDRKRAALAAHRTQLTVDGDWFTLSNGTAFSLTGPERFRLVRPQEQAAPVAWSARPIGTRIVVPVLAAVFGAAVGVLLTVVHQSRIDLAGTPVPVGVIAALTLATLLLVGLRLSFGTRAVSGAFAVGLLAAVALVAMPGPGGSILLPANPLGYTWAFGVTLVAAVVMAWPSLPPRPRKIKTAPH